MKHCATNSTGEATPGTARVSILVEYCKGCGLCVASCPNEVLQLADEVTADGTRVAMVLETGVCEGCGRCYLMCPDAAVVIEAG